MTDGGRGVGEGFEPPAVSGAWRARVEFDIFAVACLVSRVLLVAPVPVKIGFCDCDCEGCPQNENHANVSKTVSEKPEHQIDHIRQNLV